VVASSKVMKTM